MSKNDGNDPFEIEDCECIAESQKAIKVKSKNLPGGEDWFPRSQILGESEVQEEGDEGTLVIPRWLARERELTD